MSQASLFPDVVPMLPEGFDVLWGELDAMHGVRISFGVVAVAAVGVHHTVVIRVRGHDLAGVARPLRPLVAHLHQLAREHLYLDERFASRMEDARA
jgi:hypothetical protein